MRETVRPMGIDIAAPEPIAQKAPEASGDAAGEARAANGKPRPKGRKPGPHNPVRHVNFSNFIIQ